MKKKFLILGLGKSGKAAAALLLSRGEEVWGFDDAILVLESLETVGVHVITDASRIDWRAIDSLIASPGVSPEHLIYKSAVEKKIPVIGEAELALRFLNQKAVGITGTNGKTTVTALITHILHLSGVSARALGNIGEPLCSYAKHPDPQEILVIELSSFQLETLRARALDAAAILNVTPDHLERYPDMESYARAKCAIQHCLKATAPLFVQQKVADSYGHLLSAPYTPFAAKENRDEENVLAAWALCQTLGILPRQFESALKTFQKPSHRVEFVCEINGVCYYDDSKGTNVDAVVHAVQSMTGPAILIAGGIDKGASYMPWAHCLKDKIRSIITIGQAGPKIQRELHLFFPIEHVDSLEAAVTCAAKRAVNGDCVLLSPGCSSYDMFRDYAHRGEEFQRCVHSLCENRES
ncbi:MAG TPA: Mur ligase family protein [Rhabdochlamydiaceae bacterium]|jgi:UDP-N-acetylmuramoylalanine--D-glutamate ligase